MTTMKRLGYSQVAVLSGICEVGFSYGRADRKVCDSLVGHGLVSYEAKSGKYMATDEGQLAFTCLLMGRFFRQLHSNRVRRAEATRLADADRPKLLARAHAWLKNNPTITAETLAAFARGES